MCYQLVKNLPAMWETWVRKIPGGENGNPLQYSCLKNPHGQSSLVGYSPRGRKESDTAERLTLGENTKKSMPCEE